MNLFSRFFLKSDTNKLNKISKELKKSKQDLIKISNEFAEISIDESKSLDSLIEKFSNIRKMELKIAKRQLELRCQESEIRGGAYVSGERIRNTIK